MPRGLLGHGTVAVLNRLLAIIVCTLLFTFEGFISFVRHLEIISVASLLWVMKFAESSVCNTFNSLPFNWFKPYNLSSCVSVFSSSTFDSIPSTCQSSNPRAVTSVMASPVTARQSHAVFFPASPTHPMRGSGSVLYVLCVPCGSLQSKSSISSPRNREFRLYIVRFAGLLHTFPPRLPFSVLSSYTSSCLSLYICIYMYAFPHIEDLHSTPFYANTLDNANFIRFRLWFFGSRRTKHLLGTGLHAFCSKPVFYIYIYMLVVLFLFLVIQYPLLPLLLRAHVPSWYSIFLYIYMLVVLLLFLVIRHPLLPLLLRPHLGCVVST